MEQPAKDQIIVAGGGAAGMMAAIAAARAGAPVLLLEPNGKLGRKLYITGKGRCNVTNWCGVEDFLAHVARNGKFLYSAVSRFSPQDTWTFFEQLGVTLKVERGNRVFPRSDRSADVVDALYHELRRLGVRVCQDRLVGVEIREGRVTAARTANAPGPIPCSALILATGGASYPRTGSTGDGYRLAAQAGHTVVPIRGSLVPLESDDDCCPRMQGLSLRNVELTVLDGAGKRIWREQGELLFTHFGLSGPLVLSASAHLDFARNRYTAHIDLKPALSREKLDARLLRDIQARANQNFSNLLGGLVPGSMVDVVVDRTGIPREEKARDLRREQRHRLLELLKDFPVSIRGPRPVEEAIVTAGGVAVGEVNPATMESRKAGGLYLAGELLDVDAYTGGFNLQIAWATGHAAGLGAAGRREERTR